jgi:hypothetical protein
MTRRGKPVRGAIFGFLLGILVALDLAVFNVLPLGMFTVVGLPLIGLAVGLVIGLTSPFGRRPDAAPPV